MTLHPKFLTDKKGKKNAVVLPIKEYNLIVKELEQLKDIRLYDESKSVKEPAKKISTRETSILNWDELPSTIKDSVARGLAQSKAGKTIPHKEVMKKYRKWLKK